jgi:hypothetical protein
LSSAGLLCLLLLTSSSAGAARGKLFGLFRRKQPPVVFHSSDRVAQRAFARPVESSSSLEGKEHVVHLELRDGSSWYFRPEHPRNDALAEKNAITGSTRSDRERGTYITSRHLRLGVVPRTVRGQRGGQRGTLQRGMTVIEPTRGMVLDWDSVHGLAILDYVLRRGDADSHNVLFVPAGNRVRVMSGDNELTFGSRPRPPSSWAIGMAYSGPLAFSARLQRRLERVNVDAWRADLLAEGIPREDADLAVERFLEVRRLGADVFRQESEIF